MKIRVLIVALCVTISNVAMSKSLIYEKYAKTQGMEAVHVPRLMLLLSGNSNLTKIGDQNGISGSIHELYVLTAETEATQKMLVEEMKNLQKSTKYEELITVKDNGDNVAIYAKKKGDSIRELIICTQDNEDHEVVFVHITGKMKIDASKFTN
ncbi:MAG: DUF4252 domain-containing protein [Bacteroidales bacterium]|nr:DUF4252 domain-containing protein [Bacteroidales bacterium]